MLRHRRHTAAQRALLTALALFAGTRAPPSTHRPLQPAIPATMATQDGLRRLAHAEALLVLGQAQAAYPILDDLTKQPELATRALRLVAWAQLATGDTKTAATTARRAGDSLELQWLATIADWRSGDKNAAALLRTLFWREPDSMWGLLALAELRTQPGYSTNERKCLASDVPSPTARTRLEGDETVERVLAALQASAPVGGRLASQVAYAMGAHHLRYERFAQAVPLLRVGLTAAVGTDERRAVIYRLAQAERHRQNYDEARRLMSSLAERPSDRWGQLGLAGLAQMAIEERHYRAAHDLFAAKLLDNPVGPARLQALWGLGWIAFRTGRFTQARQFLDALLKEAPYGALAPRALYWAARAEGEMAHGDRALALMAALRQRFPVDYYAFRASRWLRGRSVAPALLPVRPPKALVQDLAESLRAGMPERSRRLLSSALRDLTDASPEELDVLKRAAKSIGDKMAIEKIEAARQERYPSSTDAARYVAALNLSGRQLLTTTGVSPRLQLGAFVKRPSASLSADVLLAIAASKSAVDPSFVGSRGELGLFALPPRELNALWQEEHRHRSPRSADVNNPQTCTRLGLRYTTRTLRAFDGNIEAALAALAAGPGAVTRWRAARGELPPDIFVEEIPYSDAASFVRTTLATLMRLELARSATSAIELAGNVR